MFSPASCRARTKQTFKAMKTRLLPPLSPVTALHTRTDKKNMIPRTPRLSAGQSALRKLPPPLFGGVLRPLGTRRNGYCQILWFFVLIALSFPTENESKAATYVSGTIVGQTWDKTNSPYYVTGPVSVAGLIINAGVMVIFNGNFVFEVNGLITALGTAEAQIVFAGTNEGWQGIFFNACYDNSRLRHCVISNSVNSGIRVRDCSPLLEYCRICNNSTPGNGGGINANVASTSKVLRLHSCIISNNAANPSESLGDFAGGGLYVIGKAELSGCTISGNYCYSRVILRHSNTFAYGGGAFFSGETTIFNSQFLNNVAQAHQDSTYSSSVGYPAAYGAGCYLASGTMVLRNSIMASNSTVTIARSGYGYKYGGGLYNHSGACSIENATFVYNTPDGVWGGGGSLFATNSILFWNTGPQIGGAVTVAFSDVQGGYTGDGNIDCNPLLSDLKIVPGSCCIDAGSPTAICSDIVFPPSLGGPRNDIGAHGGPGAVGWIPGTSTEIKMQPVGQSSCIGQRAEFSVRATGSPPISYQWHCSSGLMIGQTSTNLILNDLQKSLAGPYWVVVSNAWGSVTSSVAQLTVNDACIDINLYAGLNISGQQGSQYVLSFTTDINNTNNWIPLATNTMGSSGWFYLDMDTPFSPRRFFKAELKP